MASEALKKTVQKYLRPEETVMIACDVKFLKKTSGKKRARIFAIVQSSGRRRESAVLTLKAKRFQQPMLKGVYPISSSFRVKSTSESTFTLNYDGGSADEIYFFETSSRAGVKELLVPLMTLLKAAREAASMSFEWLSYYAVVDAPDNVVPDLAPSANTALITAADDDFIPLNPLIASGAALYSTRAMVNIKDQWVESQMQAREDEFSEQLPLRIFVGTWNVNGKKPGESLEPWLCSAKPCEVYAIGFQELDLSAEAFLTNNSQRSAPWELHIESALQRLGTYSLVASRQLVGMLLCVYAVTSLVPHIVEVQTDSVGVGVMGVMGNKGGVSVRFRIYDTKVCFVNSHLAARQKEIERRNQDHKEICRRLAFTRDDAAAAGSAAGGGGGGGGGGGSGGGTSRGIFDHDYLFWLGDLNYRISLPDDDVKARIAALDWEYLVQHDQLSVQRAAKNTFVGFSEGRLDFCPTYKYDPGTSRFDTSEKKRIPAWCDRVLYVAKHNFINQLFYGRHELLTSDHKPVSAVFEARSRIIIRERRAAIYHSVVRALDQLENESMPDATLSESSFQFGTVSFGEPVSRPLTITNTGQVVIKYSFVPKPGALETGYAKPWMTVAPFRGLLMPGDSAEVTLTVKVDKRSANALTVGSETLEDIMILHLENGKDYFVNVAGSYSKSCFGASLGALVRCRAPVRAATAADFADQAVVSVPKELWALVDLIYARGRSTAGLFTVAGETDSIRGIREAVDTGASLAGFEGAVPSVAETMLRFLASLETPVVPPRMAGRCIDAALNADACRDIVGVFPTPHYNTFVYVMAFLREILAVQESASAAELAFVFASALFGDTDETPTTAAESEVARLKAVFVMQFLDAAKALDLQERSVI